MIDTRQLKTFEPADYIETADDVAIFLDEAFKSGDANVIKASLAIIAKSKGITEIAKRSGIQREQIYQVLSDKGNPTLNTLLPIIKAMGFRLSIASMI